MNYVRAIGMAALILLVSTGTAFGACTPRTGIETCGTSSTGLEGCAFSRQILASGPPPFAFVHIGTVASSTIGTNVQDRSVTIEAEQHLITPRGRVIRALKRGAQTLFVNAYARDQGVWRDADGTGPGTCESDGVPLFGPIRILRRETRASVTIVAVRRKNVAAEEGCVQEVLGPDCFAQVRARLRFAAPIGARSLITARIEQQ